MIATLLMKKNIKICLLTTSLSSGGAEKIAANMSTALTKRGYTVIIVSMQNNIDYAYSGTLYNFGIVKSKYGKFKAFFKLKSFFKQNNFDFIIDHRLRDKFLKEVLLSKFVFNKSKVIYCIHNYRLEYYFSFLSIPWLTKYQHVKNASFVAVCKEVEKHTKQKLKIKSVTIYNFLNLSDVCLNEEDEHTPKDYIIGVGRLTHIKQFDKLINSYKNSKLRSQNVQLIILGSGPEKENLKQLISRLELDKYIKIIAFQENPYPFIKNAKALILSSKVEGFPMVLLEALTLGTPVVAFNCKSGPDEIIRHNMNGMLVENQNEVELTLALNKLTDAIFYKHLKAHSSLGLDALSEEEIMNQWEKLFKTIDI